MASTSLVTSLYTSIYKHATAFPFRRSFNKWRKSQIYKCVHRSSRRTENVGVSNMICCVVQHSFNTSLEIGLNASVFAAAVALKQLNVCAPQSMSNTQMRGLRDFAKVFKPSRVCIYMISVSTPGNRNAKLITHCGQTGLPLSERKK